MKFLDKLKNTFFEEEYIEVEEPEEKSEVVAKKIEPKKVERKEIKKEIKKITPIVEEEEEVTIPEETPAVNYSDGGLAKQDSKLPCFDDDDFIDSEFTYQKEEEPKKLYGGSADKLYSSIAYSNSSANKPYGTVVKEAFKPTPIISPIYGILDKNYRKEEVVDKKDKPSSYVSRKNADLDSVRRKAYGDIDSFQKELEQEEELEKSVDDNLLYDMTADNSKPTVDQVTIADAEEYFEDLGLEYNIDYKDSRYEKATGRRASSNYTNNDIKQEDSEEDANLEDNLFDLIDSMYEDGEE